MIGNLQPHPLKLRPGWCRVRASAGETTRIDPMSENQVEWTSREEHKVVLAGKFYKLAPMIGKYY